MEKIVLNMNELRRIRDYLRYVDVDTESLTNEVLQVILNRGHTGISSNIDSHTSHFLYGRAYINLKDVTDFIEGLDLKGITLMGVFRGDDD